MNLNNGERHTLIDDLTVWGDNPEPHTPITLPVGTVVAFPRWIRVGDDPFAACIVVDVERGEQYRVYARHATRAIAPNYEATR